MGHNKNAEDVTTVGPTPSCVVGQGVTLATARNAADLPPGELMSPTERKSRESLPPGTEVEVLTRYQPRWAPGFAIDATGDDGYTVRRRSDNSVLPATFPADQIRRRY